MSAYVADALALAGLAVMTIGVLGLFRMPDLYMQVHGASKAVVLGVSVIAVAGCIGADGPAVARTVLVVAALVIGSPAATHAIARAAYVREREADQDGEGRD